MNLREFGECIEFNIEHNLKHAILGLGAPGLGKSQIIHQIGQKYGYKVIDLRLAQMSEVEIGGLIYPNEDRTKTKWLSPEILPDEKRDGKNTILLLDEITSCPKRVQIAAYQLILDRRVGQYTLPEGTFVIGLGNREDDEGVYIQLAGPLADRFEIHYLDVDFESWKNDFALKYGVHSFVVDYLTFKPSALHTQELGSDEMVFATPRSWERVSDILKLDSDINKAVVCNKIIGNVGASEGSQFIEFIRSKKNFTTADEFLEGESAPTSPEEISILLNSLLEKVSFLKSVQSTPGLNAKQRENLEMVISGIFRIGQSEYVVMGLKELLDTNRRVVKDVIGELDDPGIMDFIKLNSYMLGL